MLILHQYICPECKYENSIKVKENDRGEFQMHNGDEIEVNCSKCHQKSKKHINEIYAVVNFKSTIIFIITMFFILYFICFEIEILVTTAFIFWGVQFKALKDFNSYRIRRKYD